MSNHFLVIISLFSTVVAFSGQADKAPSATAKQAAETGSSTHETETSNSRLEIPIISETGTDIGAQLNACIARFSSPTTPGICEIAPGTYSLTTTVKKPQWVSIEGNNAVITIGSASAPGLHTPAIVCANTSTVLYPTQPGTYSRRGIRNLTLIGNGPTNTPYGIWVGGDPSGGILSGDAISASATDFLEEFDNVNVQNFGSQ